MTATALAPVEPARIPWFRRALRDLVSVSTWLDTAHLLAGPIAGTITFTVTIVLVAVTASLVPLFPLAVVSALVSVSLIRIVGSLERLRIWIFLREDIASPHIDDRVLSWWRRLWSRVGRASTWKEVAYLVLNLPLGVVSSALVLAAWCVPLGLLLLPTFVWAMPNHRADLELFTISAGFESLLAAVVGAIGLVFAPVVVRLLAGFHRRIARTLLGPSRNLDARVAQLESSRSAVIDAAEAERRRIERDLHDGAQQRLVALAMDLGMARERLRSDPDRAETLLAEAHAEAKQALAELRNLARGIHPAVLTDRGLDAALSSVAARSPVPVDMRIDVGPRPGATVEGIAYFVVSEALANVAKHAQAKQARVTVARRGNRLVLEISDDGRGGADPDLGTGLAGLRDRVASVDGWLHVSSPVGGPTTLMVELPCGS